MQIKSAGYIARLWFETIAFCGVRLSALPTWLRFSKAKAANKLLTYEALVEINAQYPRALKPAGDVEINHQKKWASRVIQIANFFDANHVLEIGCGYGFASLFLAKSGKKVSATDVVDVLYSEVRQSAVDFAIGDACERLPFENGSFDLVFSINSFEHFPDPDKALSEIIRVTRPGGIIFLAFSPLYYSPWGLHASRRLGMPYPQLLFSEATIQRFVNEKQVEIAHTYDQASDKRKIGPYLNGYSVQNYRDVFKQHRAQLRTWVYTENITLDGRKIIEQYPQIMKMRVPSFDDLIVGGIKFIAQKNH